MSPDLVNGLYECIGGLFALNNCRVLAKHKRVHGISIGSTAFFASWSFWNLYYYPSLGQWWSFMGGLVIVIANVTWVSMALYFQRRKW